MGKNLKNDLFQASLNPSRVEQNYTIHFKMPKTIETRNVNFELIKRSGGFISGPLFQISFQISSNEN